MELLNYNKLQDGVRYHFDFNDNRELPWDEQAGFILKPMTGALQKRFKKMEKHEFVGKRNKQELKTNAAEVQAAVWNECVLGTFNLSLKDPTTGESRTDLMGQELFDACPPELYLEILEAIEKASVLEEGLKKQ